MGTVNGANCSFCGKVFTCGCQKTRDDAGRTVHKNCVNNANAAIRASNQISNQVKQPE
jgi:hypothetical protein